MNEKDLNLQPQKVISFNLDIKNKTKAHYDITAFLGPVHTTVVIKNGKGSACGNSKRAMKIFTPFLCQSLGGKSRKQVKVCTMEDTELFTCDPAQIHFSCPADKYSANTAVGLAVQRAVDTAINSKLLSKTVRKEFIWSVREKILEGVG